MRIGFVNNYQNNLYCLSFGINLQSPKLRFKNDDFFVKIRGYGTNSDWAKKIIETADTAVNFIRTKLDFESVLRYITIGVRKANQLPMDIDKKEHSGYLRIERINWQHGTDNKWQSIITRYGGKNSKYKEYKERFDHTVEYPLKNPYDNFMLTRPVSSKNYGNFLDHAEAKYINQALDMVNDLYIELQQKYIEKEATKSDLTDINSTIAEIRWILAHSTPWERGSDAISNTFIRSIYKAMGIKTYPLKRGVSLDLEAYCTNLEDYKKNFSSYFTHKPHIVE